MGIIEKKELKIILLLVGGLFLWFSFLLDSFNLFANGRAVIAYFIFLIIYSVLLARYVFGITNFFDNTKKIFGFILIFMISDLLFFPYVIPKNIEPIQETNLQLSSDLFLYNLLPKSIPHKIKYYLVYVFIPSLLLLLAASLLQQRSFISLLRRSV